MASKDVLEMSEEICCEVIIIKSANLTVLIQQIG
jgi:hypothetical protein